MKLLTKAMLITTLLLPRTAHSREIKIAVIDTGYTIQAVDIGVRLCSYGHKDFTNSRSKDLIPPDHHDHGTHVAGLIHQGFVGKTINEMVAYTQSSPVKAAEVIRKTPSNGYCLFILKFWDTPSSSSGSWTSETEAIKWAIKLKADVINLSLGGTDKSEEEKKVIEDAISKGILVVTVAGNERHVLMPSDVKMTVLKNANKSVAETREAYYPASYGNQTVVGALDRYGRMARLSNRNPEVGVPIINAWELGVDVYSIMPRGIGKMSGTSQAAALHSGKLARKLYEQSIQEEKNGQFAADH